MELEQEAHDTQEVFPSQSVASPPREGTTRPEGGPPAVTPSPLKTDGPRPPTVQTSEQGYTSLQAAAAALQEEQDPLVQLDEPDDPMGPLVTHEIPVSPEARPPKRTKKEYRTSTEIQLDIALNPATQQYFSMYEGGLGADEGHLWDYMKSVYNLDEGGYVTPSEIADFELFIDQNRSVPLTMQEKEYLHTQIDPYLN